MLQNDWDILKLMKKKMRKYNPVLLVVKCRNDPTKIKEKTKEVHEVFMKMDIVFNDDGKTLKK